MGTRAKIALATVGVLACAGVATALARRRNPAPFSPPSTRTDAQPSPPSEPSAGERARATRLAAFADRLDPAAQ